MQGTLALGINQPIDGATKPWKEDELQLLIRTMSKGRIQWQRREDCATKGPCTGSARTKSSD